MVESVAMRRTAPFLLAAAAAACVSPASRQACVPSPVHADRQRAYGLIHPLLDIDSDARFFELSSFQGKLKSFVEGAKAARRVSSAAVYFRDLNNGMWTGLEESASFTPASLLKLPLMMSILDRSEDEPDFLSRRLELTEQTLALGGNPTNFPPRRRLEAGRSYSVEELLQAMVSDSDNAAAVLLFNSMPPGAVEKAYADLGVAGVPGTRVGASVTVRQYASFFRVLYNASYLDRRMSQKALELLAASSFKDGIAAGLPPGVTAAHKFGERFDGETQQLHDCGIVYHPDTPYLLCVMTRGKDSRILASVIAEASRLVWDEVSGQIEQKKKKK